MKLRYENSHFKTVIAHVYMLNSVSWQSFRKFEIIIHPFIIATANLEKNPDKHCCLREFYRLSHDHLATLLLCVGMFAIRADKEYSMLVFLKAFRKIAGNKKLETKLDYKSV